MKLELKVFENESEIISKKFIEGTYQIGRAPSCDLVLSSEEIAKHQVEIRVTPSNIYVSNLSGSGSLIHNGKMVEAFELVTGDAFIVGPYKIMAVSALEASGSAKMIDLQGSPGNEPIVIEPNEGAARVFEASLRPNIEIDSPSQPLPQLDQAFSGTAALNIAETQVNLKPIAGKLIFTEGPRSGEEFPLSAYEITLGRSKKADIFLDDEKLSRIHAKISRVGLGYRLVDLNSRNGTYVNGMRILEHPLNSFDVITLGNSKIKFLIHDIVTEIQGGKAIVEKSKGVDETESLQLNTDAREAIRLELAYPPPPLSPEPKTFSEPFEIQEERKGLPPLLKIIFLTAAGVIVYYGINSYKNGSKLAPPVKETTLTPEKKISDVKLPPAMPREYLDLSPEKQRFVEGEYQVAIGSAQKYQFGEALSHLKNIHDLIPYYKQSRELSEEYTKRNKEQLLLEVQEKAKRNEKEDLAMYLEEGIDLLREGDFGKAAEAFNNAIVLDPNNVTALKGLKAAEFKVKDLNSLPTEADGEKELRKEVTQLFQKAIYALTNRSYQEAVDFAERIRKIELKGDTQYLSEAKKIIDEARRFQKEEFEPFLIQAKEKYNEGDYNGSRDLCEEMTKRDGAYEDAKECLLKAKKQLNRLAKEAYTHGYILESMNKIDEAKQYWNRAKNYVRPGDDYYDKVLKKLDQYQ